MSYVIPEGVVQNLKKMTLLMSSVILVWAWILLVFNRQSVLQTGGMEFDRHGPDRERAVLNWQQHSYCSAATQTNWHGGE